MCLRNSSFLKSVCLICIRLQILEVMKLLNELLPGFDRDQDIDTIVSDKKSFLVGHPDILRKLGINVLPNLIQVLFFAFIYHLST